VSEVHQAPVLQQNRAVSAGRHTPKMLVKGMQMCRHPQENIHTVSRCRLVSAVTCRAHIAWRRPAHHAPAEDCRAGTPSAVPACSLAPAGMLTAAGVWPPQRHTHSTWVGTPAARRPHRCWTRTSAAASAGCRGAVGRQCALMAPRGTARAARAWPPPRTARQGWAARAAARRLRRRWPRTCAAAPSAARVSAPQGPPTRPPRRRARRR